MIMCDSKLPDFLVQMVEEFDRQEKRKYALKVSSFREVSAKLEASARLVELEISVTSQYFIAATNLNFFCLGNRPALLDPIEYNCELAMMNSVAKINWNMAPGFFVIASDELGGFFLCKETGRIYDAAHYEADKLGGPESKPVFACFYDLLEWYLDPDSEDWEDYVNKRDGLTSLEDDA